MSNGHIFISYRRDDSAGYTRAIYDQLVKRFSKDRIFMDVDAIEPGLPFDEVINQAVGRCEILLAMIGKHWLEQQVDVGPRVNDPKDFVRIEIAAALSRNIRVIPILLDGASMPPEEALPEPLRAFARRNAIEVSNSRFTSDVERLVEAVSKVLGEVDVPRNQQVPLSRRSMLYWLLGGFAAIGIVPVVRWVIPRGSSDPQTSSESSARADPEKENVESENPNISGYWRDDDSVLYRIVAENDGAYDMGRIKPPENSGVYRIVRINGRDIEISIGVLPSGTQQEIANLKLSVDGNIMSGLRNSTQIDDLPINWTLRRSERE